MSVKLLKKAGKSVIMNLGAGGGMAGVYESVPTFENERFLLRFVKTQDADDLLEVYSDKNALPFFNSDNCHDDNFYYPDLSRMEKAIDFWLQSYKSKWFVRWSVIDKASSRVIGTIELFNREGQDFFNHSGLLRLDLKSEHEKSDEIKSIMSLLLDSAYSLFETKIIATKIPLYAIERKSAFEGLGFIKSDEFLVGTIDGYSYKDYWIREQ